MSEVVQTNKNADKSVKIPTRGIVGWKKLYPILKVILTKLGIQFSLEGFEAKETAQGLHLKGPGGELRQLTVCNNGVPAYRQFVCTEAYDVSRE